MKTYINIFASISMAFGAMTLLTGCYEDKGNYSYDLPETITVEFGTDENGEPIISPSVSAMRGEEYIDLTPRVYSTIGDKKVEIDANDPDYEFGCSISYSPDDSKRWTDINEMKTRDVHHFASFPAGVYTLWYTVKNLKTGVQSNFTGQARVITSTYEGWMVLSNNGADNRTRLDMIYKNSKGIPTVTKGIFEDKVPEIYDATALIMNPSRTSAGDQIFLLSKSGGYKLDATYLQTTLADNIKVFDFMRSGEPGEVIAWDGIYMGYLGGNQSRVCVTTENNAYGVHVFGANAGFEYLMNSDRVGGEATYKVAPFIGTSQTRPGASYCALFYDMTNKRFMGFDYSLEGTPGRLLFTLNDPSTNRMFSFNTGMDLVDMEKTTFSQGLVYSVLQDKAGRRHVYGINMSGYKSNNCFIQECAYDNISATDFNTATDYAFHSQFPLMFYCRGNKIYSYNLATGRLCQTLTLDPGEEVTKLKFNLYQAYPDWMPDTSNEYLNKQYNLIVASTTGGEDSGIVRFYDIAVNGQMTLLEEYKGLGERIVDVTYRERQNR